jgi:hypothetical protein
MVASSISAEQLLDFGVFVPSAETSREVERREDPACIVKRMRRGFQFISGLAALAAERHGAAQGRFSMPISALLSRIRKLIPRERDERYEEIVRGFGNGALRPPVTPMSDRELAKAIAEFLREAPSAEAVSNLGRRIDPSSPI